MADEATPATETTQAKPAAAVPVRQVASVNTPEMRLASAKRKADTLGVSYPADATEEVILKAIEDKLAEPAEVKAPKAESVDERDQRLRQELQADALRLIRVRITNMNPEKKDLDCEFVTVANRYIGTVSRLVPWGERTDDGWHVEKVLLDNMKEKQFLQVTTKKNGKGGNTPVTRWVKEYAIEELTPLTEKELQILANKQAAAAGQAVVD